MVPSWEKATQAIDAPPWALVFSVTHLMSVAIILRTREKKRCLGCMRAFGSMEIWDHSTARLQVPKGADMQQPTACRKDECGMWLRSSSRTKSHMPLREAAQLGVSGLGSQVVVKRTWVERSKLRLLPLECAADAVVFRVMSSQVKAYRGGVIPHMRASRISAGVPYRVDPFGMENPSVNGL